MPAVRPCLIRREQFETPGDASKEIVEVVSDAAGKTTDRLHFCGHAELLFEGATFGDVFGEDFVGGGGL